MAIFFFIIKAMPIDEVGETKPVLLVTFPNAVNKHLVLKYSVTL